MQPDSIRAVVTGGVSGLGLAVATRIVADGGKAALFDVNDEKGAAAVAALGEANARYFRTDVTDEDGVVANVAAAKDFLKSEEHTSELQSLMRISYAVFCLKKKKEITNIII